MPTGTLFGVGERFPSVRIGKSFSDFFATSSVLVAHATALFSLDMFLEGSGWRDLAQKISPPTPELCCFSDVCVSPKKSLKSFFPPPFILVEPGSGQPPRLHLLLRMSLDAAPWLVGACPPPPKTSRNPKYYNLSRTPPSCQGFPEQEDEDADVIGTLGR